MVVEDEASCKCTVQTPDFSAVFGVKPDGTIGYMDGSESNPICLPELQVQDEGTVPGLVSKSQEGCLVSLQPFTGGSEPTIQLLSANNSGDIFFVGASDAFGAGCGVLVRDCETDSVIGWQDGEQGQVLGIDEDGNARFLDSSALTSAASIDASGINIAYASGTNIIASFSYLVVRNSSNGLRQLTANAVSINNSVIGVNGLDAGSIAADTFYWVYVIFNPETGVVGGLVSLNSTTPVLPSGFTYYRLIGGFATGVSAGWRPGMGQHGSQLVFAQASTQFTINGTACALLSTTSFPVSLTPFTAAAPVNLVKATRFTRRWIIQGSGTTAAIVTVQASNGTSVYSSDSLFQSLAFTVTGDYTVSAAVWLPYGSDITQSYWQVSGGSVGGGNSSVSLIESGWDWNFI